MSELKDNDLKERFEKMIVELMPTPEQYLATPLHVFIYTLMTDAYNLDRDNDEWVSVDDQLPPFHTPLFVYCTTGDVERDVEYGNLPFHKEWGASDFKNYITHWMRYKPLPNPPQS